jgi:hypothetical protein
MAAGVELNDSQISLVGLLETGVEFLGPNAPPP